MPISKQALEDAALSEEEYRLIVQRLGREPTMVELGMFGSLWSEHCGYKHSKSLLKLFPTESPRVLTKVGEENAGVVDIGEGLCVVIKIESHNHPSAIEPYQAAATGVGGVVRDILTMGARPIALLDSLRFGPITDPHNSYLFREVVRGIASYGNCLGIPSAGGEVFFARPYSSNPLVNAMCVGIVEVRKIVRARASGVGNLLMLVGADTGRDGVHGATFASADLAQVKEQTSAVAIGDPSVEKRLIEACLELIDTDWVIGMQDLGAAGLTCSTVECAAKGGSGIEIDVLRVPRREQGMSPYEVMLSESQERMLVIVKKGCEDKVKEIFDRWDLRSDIIGQVTDDGMARIKEGQKVVAEVPAKLLTDPPLYHPKGVKPPYLDGLQSYDLEVVPDLEPQLSKAIFLKLLSSPNIASKEWVYRQYDHQVQTNTVIPPGGDAAVLRIKDTQKAIALTTDGNGRYCYLDPYQGGAIAVAEAARNLVCAGAEPLAITDCLNFGNPERPDIYYQLEQCIRGMAQACQILDIPVISGNVSLYNETREQAIYPTPVVGMVGLIEDVEKRCTIGFKGEGDLVFLLGEEQGGKGIGGSEYLETIHGIVAGKPAIDLDLEKRVQKCCLEAIRQGLVKSAHDTSEGGLAITLAECCIAGGLGFRGKWEIGRRLDAALFGEAQARIVVSVEPAHSGELERIAARYNVPLKKLGQVAGQRFTIEGYLDLPLKEIERAWQRGLEECLTA